MIMGPRYAPHYADIFMSRKIDPQIKELFKIYEEQNKFNFMTRFLDDIFKIFVGTSQNLHMFLDELNKIHPSIKFTMSQTNNSFEDFSTKCTCTPQDSIQFLDTSCMISEGKINLDLFKKPTDRNMYLLPSSCHPPHQHENVPYGLAMRINRICNTQESRQNRFSELKDFLINREYRPGMVDAAINKAKNIPREVALRKVVLKLKETCCSGILGPSAPPN